MKHFTLRTHAGKCLRHWLPITGSEPLPISVLCGSRPGPTVLVTAGIHSAESVGIQAALELARELEPRALRGCVVIAPVVNRDGFTRHIPSTVAGDGKNLNRVFPGQPDGTLAERIAFAVTEGLLRRADFYIDLHGGDINEELTPYIYCAGACTPETARRSREMALAADVPYLTVSPLRTSGAYNVAAALGVPSVLLERGCGDRRSHAEVDADKKDVRSLLRALGGLDGEPEPRTCIPQDVGTLIYTQCVSSGFWYPEKRAGARFRTGELLGTVRGWDEEPLQTVTAQADGILLYQLSGLNALAGSVLTACGSNPEGRTAWN